MIPTGQGSDERSMELNTVLELLSEYGIQILLTMTFLEALNCPGMPAGVVLPAAGVYASTSEMTLVLAVVLTIIGSCAGTVVLYMIGRIGGRRLLDWLKKRSNAIRKAADRCEGFLQKGGFTAIFIGRILPVIRTILPLPAGAFGVPLSTFIPASILGISCYNIVLVSAGYFLASTITTAL